MTQFRAKSFFVHFRKFKICFRKKRFNRLPMSSRRSVRAGFDLFYRKETFAANAKPPSVQTFWVKRFLNEIFFLAGSKDSIELNQVHPHSINVTTWKRKAKGWLTLTPTSKDGKRNFVKLYAKEKEKRWR